MGALIDFYRSVMLTRAGGVKQFGQTLTPLTSVDSGTNDGPTIDDSVPVASLATATLWQYGVGSYDWAFGLVEFAGSVGSIWLIVTNDTAGTDGAPTGSAVTKNRELLVNNGSRIWGARDCLTNPSTANHAGDGTGEVLGKITKIEAYNPTGSAIRLRRLFLG